MNFIPLNSAKIANELSPQLANKVPSSTGSRDGDDDLLQAFVPEDGAPRWNEGVSNHVNGKNKTIFLSKILQ